MSEFFTSFQAATTSYLIAAVFFLGLSIYAIYGWYTRLTGRLLLIASLISFAWAAIICSQSIWDIGDFSVRYSTEVLRNAAWLFLLLRILGIDADTIKTSPLSVLSLLTIFTALLVTFQFFAAWSSYLPLINHSSSLLVGHVLVGLIGLVLIEQILRNTRSNRLYQIKFICLGIGIIFSYDFFMYAHALLFKHIDPALWDARGVVNALAVPFIALASFRNRQAPMKFNLSGDFVFHTGITVFSAIYLLTMAGIGYFIRIFGGTWGDTLQILFIVIALVTLFALIFSGKVRTHVRVFLSRRVFSYQYDYRHEWMRITKTLSSQNTQDPLQYKAIYALANIVGSNGGALWIRNQIRAQINDQTNTQNQAFNYQCSYVLDSPKTTTEPLDSAFSQFLLSRRWVIDLNELKANPELYDFLELPEWLSELADAWLIAPLMLGNTLYGFIIINKPLAKISLNREDHDLIKIAGRQVASELAQQSASEALAKAREFDAFNQMSAFIVHDIKTLVSQLSLMVKNADKHKSNPAFIDDMIKTSQHSVQKMTRLLEQLKNRGTSQALHPVELFPVLHQVTQERANNTPKPTLTCADKNLKVMADEQQLHTVFNHILQNAQDATPANGAITVTLSRSKAEAIVNIKDTGMGMTEAFIKEQLFQPFKSTKGVAGMGIGAYQCKQYISQTGGHIKVKSQLGTGTEFDIVIPLFTESTDSSH